MTLDCYSNSALMFLLFYDTRLALTSGDTFNSVNPGKFVSFIFLFFLVRYSSASLSSSTLCRLSCPLVNEFSYVLSFLLGLRFFTAVLFYFFSERISNMSPLYSCDWTVVWLYARFAADLEDRLGAKTLEFMKPPLMLYPRDLS